MAMQIRAEFLSRFKWDPEWKKAPNTLKLQYGQWEILYVKGSTGYSGRVRDRKTSRVLGFRHNVTLRGQHAEYISPAIITNGIAQQKGLGNEKGWVSKNKYFEALTLVLDSVITATLTGMHLPQESAEDAHTSVEAPGWMVFGDGETSEEALKKAAFAGVPEYLIEFCSVAGYSFEVDVQKLIQQRVNPKYNIVQKGAWDDRSQTISKTLNLSSGLCFLAREAGLKLETQTGERKRVEAVG